MVLVRLADHDNGERFLVALMVVSGRRRSTLVVAAAASGRRRRRPADLLSVVAAGGPDLLQVVVSVEILPVAAVVVAVGSRWFHLRSRQSF